MGLNSFTDMVSQLTINTDSTRRPVTDETYKDFCELYLFDRLREKSVGLLFCEYFGVNDSVLRLPLSTSSLVEHIQRHYLSEISN